MGNVFSGASVENSLSSNVNAIGESEMGDSIRDDENDDFFDSVEDYQDARSKRKEEQLSEFKKQLDIKREQRRNILDRHRAEKKKLEETLHEERKSKLDLLKQNKILQELLQANNIQIPETSQASSEYEDFLQIIEKMNEEVDVLKTNNNRLRSDLANSNKALQEANSDIASLSAQNTESIKQINALKEVIAVTKTMINLRENQLLELKNKLNEIEQSLADREASMLSTDLRQEYERQLNNIRTLRGLYEERARLAEVTKQALVRDLDEQKRLLQVEVSKNEDLNNKIQELENKVNILEDTVNDKNSSIATFKEECRGLQNEMTVVNKLFSQVLLGYKSKKDLDKLVTRLEENHGILTHMVEQENGSEGSSALPKMLLELVGQIEENDVCVEKYQDNNSNDDTGNRSTENVATIGKAEEIVQNLPKVWRVLMELLSHQSEAEMNSSEKVTTCYKPVHTKSGTVLVPSVSQTYIRLKDLILEKLSLIKEVNRMKQLNTHLESRLQEQEKRLCSVTNELSKTWHVVGRLRRHHQQLHTHEKILKYELQQKRKLLNELKEELEYCREKWEQAREKNTQSEKDWKKLRIEFSNRKLDSMSFNNSAESGYSDERPSDESSGSNDESEYTKEPKLKCKKKLKKSFETIVDSSTDLNLAAERDDPVSDMLDVADISLDTQEDNVETFDHSDSCTSENVSKSERIADTEDECLNISHDLVSHETGLHEKCNESDYLIVLRSSNEASQSRDSLGYSENTYEVLGSKKVDLTIQEARASNSKSSDPTVPEAGTSQIDKPILAPTVEVDFKAILESVKQQDKRLQLKDERLQKLEHSTSVVVSNLSSTLAAEESMISRLDTLNSLHNREFADTECAKATEDVTPFNESEDYVVPEKAITKCEPIKGSNKGTITTISEPSTSKYLVTENHGVDIDSQAILENVRLQEQKLRTKDKRLENLEEGCSNALSNLNATLHIGDTMISRLDTVESGHNKEKCILQDSPSNSENTCLEKDNETQSDTLDVDNEPSTSSEQEHKARFAARDIRLKRLEEQTKSLVNRVNKTTTKGVKIHYKLEELQNIYSSDNSRSGTPSDDTEDISQKTDDGSQEE